MSIAGKFPAVLAYVLGPILGGIAGALVYDKIIAPATTPESPTADTDTDKTPSPANEREGA